jgi:vancomycin resistance protein YoaR
LLVVLGIVAAAYVGAAIYFGDRVAAGTKVGGVALGGMTQDEARTRLQGAIDRQARTPVTINGPEQTSYTIAPKEAGLAADADASIEGLIGFTLNPLDLWRHVSGHGEDLPLTVTSDRGALEAAIAEGARATVDRTAREGALRFIGRTVAYTAPVSGRAVDAAATAETLLGVWPQRSAVTATMTEQQPSVPASAFDSIRRDLADKVVAGPVIVQAGPLAFEVPPERLTPSVSFVAASGTVTEKVDDKKLAAAVVAVARAKGIAKDAKDASVYFTEGSFGVRPAVTGRSLRADAIAKPVRAAWLSPTRRAAVPLVTTQPKVTTQQARASLPKGLISSFTTHFPDNPVRTNNLRVAAARLNGTFVPKGGTLSLNALLGQRTPEKGYKKAQVIYDGRLTYDYGGGISQVSTTLFNAAFFAGVQIDEHLPHSFYISRYPVGREATISWPDLDNRWTNTTDGGILIRAWLAGNDITVQFYGVKTYDVQSITGPRRNVVKPRTINDDSATCVPQSPSDGFDITVTRVIRRNGAVVKREDYNTHYIPEDRVICKTPYDPN